MNERERLIELIGSAVYSPTKGCLRTIGSKCNSSLIEAIADYLLAHGVTVQEWIPASEPPDEYRDEYGELIPFLVCLDGTEYPFRAMYDGKVWGDGWGVIPVKYWMPLPPAPKGE